MSLKETILKIKGKPYIELCLISGTSILKKYHIPDIGARWFLDEKLGMAFLIPDTVTEGLKDRRKTIIYYKPENAVPLVLASDFTENEYIYTITEKNQLKSLIYTHTETVSATKKVNSCKYIPVVIDSRVLASLVNAKVVTDLLKPSVSKWEALKLPLMIAGIALCIIGLAMVM